jgi:uncharacterized protein (DUF1697 family)
MKFVIFLRAINIGGRRIKMHDLRRAFVDAGFNGAETHIATGNVIIEASAAPSRPEIEEIMTSTFGFTSEAFIRSEDDILSILARNPWQDPGVLVEVSFLEGVPDPDASRMLEGTVEPPEALVVSDAEVFFLREGKGIPTVHKESTTVRSLGMQTTRRGIATVQQIKERFLAE